MKYLIVFPESRDSSYSCDHTLAGLQKDRGGFSSLAELHDAIAQTFPRAAFITPFSSLLHFDERRNSLEVFVINRAEELPRTRTYKIDRAPAEPPVKDLTGLTPHFDDSTKFTHP